MTIAVSRTSDKLTSGKAENTREDGVYVYRSANLSIRAEKYEGEYSNEFTCYVCGVLGKKDPYRSSSVSVNEMRESVNGIVAINGDFNSARSNGAPLRSSSLSDIGCYEPGTTASPWRTDGSRIGTAS